MKVTLNTTMQNANTNFAVRKNPQDWVFSAQNQAEIPEQEQESNDDGKFLVGLSIFTALCIGAISTLSGKEKPVNVVKTTLPAVIPAEVKSAPKTAAEKAAILKQIQKLRDVLKYAAEQPERAAEKSSRQSKEMIEQRIQTLTNRLIYV